MFTKSRLDLSRDFLRYGLQNGIGRDIMNIIIEVKIMVEMNGKLLRDKKLTELKEKISKLDCQLGLAVIQVGQNEASTVYVNQKKKIALELGYKFIHKVFDENEPAINTLSSL